MSSRKDKFLESARKLVLKGQLDRAIKDYEQVVAIDPGDMKHRQKLAELLVRVNRKAVAIKEYEAIGTYYAENGYYLKAIAVYKQIQKLDPADIKVSLKLADFNKKQGLTGNALAEYGVVYSYYQKIGDNKELVKILDKMLEVDPDNLNTRLKYAEARYTAGEWDEAYHDFSRLALQLYRKGDKQSFARICERIQSLFPDRNDFVLDMLESQVENGEAAQAIPRLQEIIKRDNYSMTGWRLLANAYRKIGDDKGLNSVFRYMIHFFPKELFPRESLIQSAIDSGDITKALEQLQTHLNAFLEQNELIAPECFYNTLLEMAPGDPSVFQALQAFYEATGQTEKLENIASRLPSLEEEAPAPETVILSEEGPHVSASFEGASAAGIEPDEVWEEELDLSMVEELARQPVIEHPGDVNDVDEAAESAEQQFIDEEPHVPTIVLDINLDDEDNAQTIAELLDDSETEPLFTEDDLPTFTEFSNAVDDLFRIEESPQTAAPARKSNKYSLDELLSRFKHEVHQQLDETDFETHYNLGIAYKEMGLLDDAISELKVAATDSKRTVNCLTLCGICLKEKGETEKAEEAFTAALEPETSTIEEIVSVKYELASLYDEAGRKADAERLFQEVQDVMPDFRDTTTKLRHLRGEADTEVVDLDAEGAF